MNGALSTSKHVLRRTHRASPSHLYTTITATTNHNIFHKPPNLRSILTTINTTTNTTDARKLFDEIPHKTSPLYNLMIKCYTRNHQPVQALHLFAQMLLTPQSNPDNFTYTFILKACSSSRMLNKGRLLHGRAVVSGFEPDGYVNNSLLAMYMNCGETGAAQRVFCRMHEKTVVSWNTMINGYVLNGVPEESMRVFNQLMSLSVELDDCTLISVLSACAALKELQRGREVHTLIKRKGIVRPKSVWNALVNMYSRCGCLSAARKVFDEMNDRDVVSWTTMIGGYVMNDDARRALPLCYSMQLEGVRPNSVTVANLLSACVSSSDMKHGKCIHGWVTRCRLETDVIVETSLIDLYAKCHRMDLSIRVFRNATRKRTVPWNAIIAGYVYNGFGGKAIEIFKQMQVEMVEPNAATLISLLPAYADLADLQQGRNIHCYLIKSGFHPRIETSTTLIDIYSKCGSLDFAHQVFNMIPEADKDIVTWSAIISGYGMHGNGEIAVSLFDQMVKAGVEPNEVTFTSVLHACSHAGLVDEGLRLFKSMAEDHKRRPHNDHFTCIVDLVGRAGKLNEAYNLIEGMPIEPNYAVWGALLGACVIHHEVELGEVAAKKLFELEPDNTGNYVLMSKLYAAAGRWKDSEYVRSMIQEKGLIKTPGCSSIEVTDMVIASNLFSQSG